MNQSAGRLPPLASKTLMQRSELADRVIVPVLGSPIDAMTWSEAVARLRAWASRRESRYVCICNAHSVVTAQHDRGFAAAIAHADMATSDGAPVAWMMRRLGHPAQRRVSGPDLMWQYCQSATDASDGIFLYGAAPATLDLLENTLRANFPKLTISGKRSPPFRLLTPAEEQSDIDLINASGAGIVWVSLGCPKQELWMARHVGRIQAVMVGVGAAFDFHAGKASRAPPWMQKAGLEWLHRLASEPRRLWRRYLVTNTLFIVRAARQLIRHWTGRPAG